MTKNGEVQDITYFPINSVQNMVIQTGTETMINLVRIAVKTEIEYFDDAIQNWQSGKVISYNTVKVGDEAVVLPANTPIRLKENTQISGILILSTKKYSIEYGAEDLQQMYQFLYSSGIVKNKLFGDIIASGGREITIQSSMFVIDGFVGFFKTPQKIIVDAGDFSLRKDLLVLRKVQSEGDVYLTIKKGIPKINPTIPSLEQNQNGIYEIPIAEIQVQANTQTINQSDIKDIRPIILSADNPVIPPYYIQFAEDDGSFDDDKSPERYYKRHYGINTIWELKYNNESVYFRTEGSLSEEERENGIQGDAAQLMNAQFVTSINDYTPNMGISQIQGSAKGFGSMTNARIGVGGNLTNPIPANRNAYYGINISNSFNGGRTASETRTKNRLIRIFERIA